MDDAKSRLSHLELASIDLTVTALERAGHLITDTAKDDNPRQQMAEAWADAHHPTVELTEHDRDILRQIKTLASGLKSRTSLPGLLTARGKIVRGG